MDLAPLLDASSAAIVVGGTALATVLRCGLDGCTLAAREIAQLGRRKFDPDGARAQMAAQLRAIEQDGLFRAEPSHFGDPELDQTTGVLFGTRSVKALLAAHETQRTRRLALARRAAATLAQAAELAPVFGMVGTLVALSQLPEGGLAKGAFTGTIAMAVLTTLYGLLLANLVLAPLARAIDRAAQAEDQEREQLIDWLAAHVGRHLPQQLARSGPRPVPDADDGPEIWAA